MKLRNDEVWIHNAELGAYSRVRPGSVPAWEAVGWTLSEGPDAQPDAPAAGVSIETPESAPSTKPASLKKDSGSPQED